MKENRLILVPDCPLMDDQDYRAKAAELLDLAHRRDTDPEVASTYIQLVLYYKLLADFKMKHRRAGSPQASDLPHLPLNPGQRSQP